MTAKIFVDTNVLVYARDMSDPARHAQAWAWMADLWSRKAGLVSYQVLQEYYVTVTRKLDPPRSAEDARGDVLALVTWRPVTTDIEVMDRAWAIQDRFGFSWWDALILGAAQSSGCTHVLTEDLQDGQKVGQLLVVDPFQHDPADFLP